MARTLRPLVAAFVLPCLVAGLSYDNTDRNGSSHGVAATSDAPTTSAYPTVWLADLFYEALRDFAVSKDLGNSACRRQTHMYVKHLENGSHWAAQMSDSWSRYPTGILVSSSHHMGVYTECVEVHQPVQGKYCLPSVRIKTATDKNFTVGMHDNPEVFDPAWREILGFRDIDVRMKKNILNFGVCIPDSCSAQDLEISLQRVFNRSFLPHQVKAEVNVDPILCSTSKDMYPFDIGFYLSCALIGLILLACCVSTVYHFVSILRSNDGKKTSEMPMIMSSFSVIKNGRDLIKFDKNNKLNLFNGLKVWTMVLVLFGHKFLYTVTSPILNGNRYEMIYRIGPNILLTCMNMVDPFFYIAGYLMYALSVPEFSKPRTNWSRISLIFVYKYLRILPAYLMMMLLTAFIVPHLGSGPFWAARMWPEAEKCKTYWWANILAVSNFIEVDQQCLVAGWYISCLLQFTAIGLVIIYIYVKNRKIGTYIMVALLVISLATSFVTTYTNRAFGLVKVSYEFLLHPGSSFEFSNLYRYFYLRGTPFYAGLIAGVVVHEMKKREIKPSLLVVYVGTAVISAIAIWIQLSGGVLYELHRPYDVMEHSIYAVLKHCTWTVILFWVTVCHFTSGYGPLEKLLNNRLTVPLGRLSFAVYLVNITVMLMIQGRESTSASVSPEFSIDGWIFSTFRTYLVGILLYFTIEVPFGLLIKVLVYGNQKNRTKNDCDENPANPTAAKIEEETEQKDLTRL